MHRPRCSSLVDPSGFRCSIDSRGPRRMVHLLVAANPAAEPALMPFRSLVPLALLFASPTLASAADVSFERDVMPVLSRAGCNAGACHGNLNGKGGLKLSLKGEDPAADLRRPSPATCSPAAPTRTARPKASCCMKATGRSRTRAASASQSRARSTQYPSGVDRQRVPARTGRRAEAHASSMSPRRQDSRRPRRSLPRHRDRPLLGRHERAT